MRLYHVRPVAEVLHIIQDNFSRLALEEIAIEQAGGRVLASDIIAPEDVPGFSRSTVDGYAVKASDTFGAGDAMPAMLNLSGEVKMGETAPRKLSGGVVAIPTGGMMPDGADAVVMVEDTDVVGSLVNVYHHVAPGENVIARGEDISCGSIVIPAGRKLRAPELGVLASLGITRLEVSQKPRVGVLSTGDEIVSYTTAVLESGKIRDSNAIALGEMIRIHGGEAINAGIIGDTYEQFYTEITRLLKQVDFLVLSGGSSVGMRDYTTEVMKAFSEGPLLVEGVAIQPGKPTLLAKCLGKPVLGLPGHPISALNIFRLFGLPIMNRLQGLDQPECVPTVKAVLARNIPSRTGRTDFVRVKLEKLEGQAQAMPVFGRSGLLRSLAEAQGLVVVPEGSEGLLAGVEVEVILWE